ncbi:hypothetical protein QMW88_00550 [Cronobacter dublinensis]|nr:MULTISPECIES: hypothetical protein [Cronobacter]MDI6431323.1 hypothetical protein [Cronobacter turicensis]MDK1194475.1 hypothetical protein [Cronobacter dublinensis]MDK1199767.1 hypothetical protein [Cronobacter dublinensis]
MIKLPKKSESLFRNGFDHKAHLRVRLMMTRYDKLLLHLKFGVIIMQLTNGRPSKDFVVGTYSYTEIKDPHFMAAQENRAKEELKEWGYEYAYTKIDAEVNGEFVRVYRVYTDKKKESL